MKFATIIFIIIAFSTIAYAQTYLTIENGVSHTIFSEREQNPGNLIIICFDKAYIYGCGGQYERLHIIDVKVKNITIPEAVTIPYTFVGGGLQKRFTFIHLRLGIFVFDKTKPDLSQIVQAHGSVHFNISIEDWKIRLGCHHWSDAHSAEGKTQEFCGFGIGVKF